MSGQGTEPTFGAGIWMFGRFLDRYATDGYGPPVSMAEAVRRAAEVDGIETLDLNLPFWGSDDAELREALADTNLRVAAITPEIYTQEFRRGSFTNPNPATRRRARDLVLEATEVARGFGADYVKLWPGQDGFDYPLQTDPRRLWELTVQGIREVAEANPDVRYALEYKPKEPRTHMVLSSAARTLLAIEDVGLDNVGILLDLGHSLYAGESPADAAQLIIGRGRLFGIDFNDNFRSWDDDLAVGSVHLIETLEFLLELRRCGWEGVWQLDQFPFREDPVAAARASIRVLRALARVVDRLDTDAFAAAQESQDALEAQAVVHDVLLAPFIAGEEVA